MRSSKRDQFQATIRQIKIMAYQNDIGDIYEKDN